MAELSQLLATLATLLTLSNAGDYLRPGDLVFQDLDCGELCTAIETVTQGVCGSNFSHVGMVAEVHDGKITVVEAIGPGVILTPLETFLARSADSKGRPKVLVGRTSLSPEQLAQAVKNAVAMLGVPYDSVFLPDNNSLYCSELLYEAFRFPPSGGPLFGLAPMTFKDPATSAFFPAWVAYYAQLNVPIPQDQPGINPGGISRSPLVTILGAFGRPDGLTPGCNSALDSALP